MNGWLFLGALLIWWQFGYRGFIWGTIKFQEGLNREFPTVAGPIKIDTDERVAAILLGMIVGPFAYLLEDRINRNILKEHYHRND